jgi:hypothetical protein
MDVMRDLMLRFASLGDNCELGVVQRDHQANAMDLLRWAATPVGVLLRLLDEDFQGIGDNLTVRPAGPAYWVTNDHYGFKWHDWTRAEKASIEVIAQREARRLPAMAAKLRKEMREGSRIFVVKQARHVMSQALAERVHQAMGANGQPILLYVNQGAPVSVTEVAPRLFSGTIPEFANPGRVPSTTRTADWTALCQATADLADQLYPALKPVPAAAAG